MTRREEWRGDWFASARSRPPLASHQGCLPGGLLLARMLPVRGRHSDHGDPTVAPGQTASSQSISAARISFDIPPQSLAKALAAYSAMTGIEILADARDIQDRQSVGVKGVMATRPALITLLMGNQLSIREFGTEAIVLSPADTTRLDGLVSTDEQAYYAVVETAILRRLCHLKTTVPAAFPIAVKLWIGPTGQVMRAKRLAGTGDSNRDAALDTAFDRLEIGVPPADLRQPIAVVVTPQVSSNAACSAAADAAREAR